MLPGWHLRPTRMFRLAFGLGLVGGLAGCSTPDKLPMKSAPSTLSRLPSPSNVAGATAKPDPGYTRTGAADPSRPPVAAMPAAQTSQAAAITAAQNSLQPQPGQQPPIVAPTVPNNPGQFPNSPAAAVSKPPSPVQPAGALPPVGVPSGFGTGSPADLAPPVAPPANTIMNPPALPSPLAPAR